MARQENRPRGVIVDELIAKNDLTIQNVFGGSPTYKGYYQGNACLDITLTSSEMSGRVGDWTVRPDETTSDHALITYTVNTGTKYINANSSTNRYVWRDVDWDKFRKVLKKLVSSEADLLSPDVDICSAALDRVLSKACESTIRKASKPKVKPTNWWNPELESTVRKLKTLRKAVKTARNLRRRRVLRLRCQKLALEFKRIA